MKTSSIPLASLLVCASYVDASPFDFSTNCYEESIYETPAKENKSYRYTIQSAGKDKDGNVCGAITIVDKNTHKNIGVYDYKSIVSDPKTPSFNLILFNKNTQKELKWKILEDRKKDAITIVINSIKHKAVKTSNKIVTNEEIQSVCGTEEGFHAYLEPIKTSAGTGYATARISNEKKEAAFENLQYSFNPFSVPGRMWSCASEAADGAIYEITFLSLGKTKGGNIHGIREIKVTRMGRVELQTEKEYEVESVDKDGYTIKGDEKHLIEDNEALWIGGHEYRIYEKKLVDDVMVEKLRRETNVFKLGK